MTSIRTILTGLIVLSGVLAWAFGLLPLHQLGIAAFGVTAVNLTQASDPRAQRWAPIFGLAGQPFWFYATSNAEQWGIFVVCFLYTLSWLRGLWNHWIEPLLDEVGDRLVGERRDET